MKVISVNIEGHNHLARVAALIKDEQPDVVCLMEAFEDQLGLIAGEKYPYISYTPNNLVEQYDQFGPGNKKIGVAILSKYAWVGGGVIFYAQGYTPNTIPVAIEGIGNHAPVVLMQTIKAGDDEIRIGVTHFTWTQGGQIDDQQRLDINDLMQWLKLKGEFVLVGDFNLPRGNELYRHMAAIYQDNIPAEVKTTIDPILHKANKQQPGKLEFVVDYIWSTPKYNVSKVRVVGGVSDHMAIVSNIEMA